ncbi:MAG: hypothetical protein DLM67_01925, partial [Candidatus Nephthysia bennettiae]
MPGLVGGLVFAMWAMMVGIFSSNLWAPPQGIGQAVGIGHPGHDFQLAPFIAGLIGHMMNSIILGAIFIAVAVPLPLRGRVLVVAGMVWGLIVYAAMYWVILRGLVSGSSGSFLSESGMAEAQLQHAGLAPLFEQILTADSVRRL